MEGLNGSVGVFSAGSVSGSPVTVADDCKRRGGGRTEAVAVGVGITLVLGGAAVLLLECRRF